MNGNKEKNENTVRILTKRIGAGGLTVFVCYLSQTHMWAGLEPDPFRKNREMKEHKELKEPIVMP